MRILLSALLSLPTFAWAEAPRVATDIAPVHALVSTVMQGVGTPSLLIPPGASPHSYAMRPSEARGVARADLVVWVGEGLTPWLEDPLDSLAPDARKLSLLETPGMVLLSFREGAGFEAHYHEGHEDHADHKDDDQASEAKDHDDHDHDAHKDDDHDEHGHEDAHDHSGADPHLWLDPKNAAAALGLIAETLAEMDPENADLYQSNAAAGQAELEALSIEISTLLEGARGKPYVVFHDAYHYFEARFDIEATASVRAGDAADPGAARVAELQDHLAETGAICAFAEPQMNTSLLQTITEGRNTRLGTLDPLGATQTPGPTLYVSLLRSMAQAMAACLTAQG